MCWSPSAPSPITLRRRSNNRVAAVRRPCRNWLTGELFRYMNESLTPIEQVKITPAQLAELIDLVEAGTINLNTGKRVLGEMFKTGESAKAIVEAKGLAQISDTSAIEAIVTKVLDANPAEVEKYPGRQRNRVGFPGRSGDEGKSRQSESGDRAGDYAASSWRRGRSKRTVQFVR